jgi:hypothetical protein
MTKTQRSNAGSSRIDADSAIVPSESSWEDAINLLSASLFESTNVFSRGPMTRLMALRMTTRRVQRRIHSLETGLPAVHSRNERIKHSLAASESAVSNRASLCKPIRSHSNTLTNSSLRTSSTLSPPVLSNQWTFITLVLRMPFIIVRVLSGHGDASAETEPRTLHIPIRDINLIIRAFMDGMPSKSAPISECHGCACSRGASDAFDEACELTGTCNFQVSAPAMTLVRGIGWSALTAWEM